ncbi:MAG: D-Ala-D-Ala carboxypeptidase family metallohydrolase, partial [Microcystis panniformis]
MRELEKIRTDYGKPIIITSGYRPEQINRAVGGVSNSQHIRGTAVDSCPPTQGTIPVLIYPLLKFKHISMSRANI